MSAMIPTPTALASSMRPLWRLLERYEVDPKLVFREAGMDPALMNEPRARHPSKRVDAAWTKAAALIADPCFGLRLAETWSPTDLHALGCAFLASSTLRTALERLARYVYIVDHIVGVKLTCDEERFSVVLPENLFSYPKTAAEEDATLAWLISLCRMGYGEQLNPVEVRLKHNEPRCESAYERFYRCPVRLGTGQSLMAFARTDVDRPLPAPNRELARASDAILAKFLASLNKGDVIGRVRAAIADELPSGTPTDEVIARAVCMSPRTLRRRLFALGTSYTQLLDEVRRELAKQYLVDPSCSLSEAGFLLGFSEASAFSRAFKRWSGQTPSEFRDTALSIITEA
jgi:AraC-like DNA-binding protein